jgi:protein-S-isoprenylcysteine O-methyltransferase Ste14
MAQQGRTGHRAWTVTKAIAQLVVFWFVFLFVLPIGISIVEVELGIQRFPPRPVLAAIGLLMFTALGLWAGITLALRGDGTPLPTDRADRLVVGGPYAFVRHPLIIAALGQGTSITLALGSVPVAAYVLTGVLVWYVFVRPLEERDLAKRFGGEWRQYSQHVRIWRPRLRPYRPA